MISSADLWRVVLEQRAAELVYELLLDVPRERIRWIDLRAADDVIAEVELGPDPDVEWTLQLVVDRLAPLWPGWLENHDVGLEVRCGDRVGRWSCDWLSRAR